MNGFNSTRTALQTPHKKNPPKRPFGAYLDGELIRSRAWLSLRSSAVQVYALFESMVIKQKPKKKGKSIRLNERNLKFTYSQAKL
ncbi:MAG: hypothetical protein ABSF52_10085 [Syntrophobacteraceae bacterium]